MKPNYDKIKTNENILLLFGGKKPKASYGHRAVKQSGDIHSDKRVDKPGSKGRKQDQIKRRIDDEYC